ncbi:MAG: pyroglutamyl-peptidase I [Planctomycetota bacterium]
MLLVTGFEPYGGLAANPSGEVAAALAGEGVEAAVLPVDYAAIGPRLEELLGRDWRAVLMLGVDPGGSKLRVERVALNYRSPKRADNRGRRPETTAIVPGGPAARFATLDPDAVHQRLREAGFAARVSLSAGDYLCNASFYIALGLLQARGTPCGFIHLPPTPDLGAPGDPWPLRELVRAARVATRRIRV